MNYALLGKQIRKQRLALGMTQEKLAEAIGRSTSYVGHIERGTRKASIDTLVALSNVMNVSTDCLLSGNLTTVHQGMPTKKLTRNQRQIMQEILDNLQENLNNWHNNAAEAAKED